MSCSNCHIFKSTCKAECCYTVPIEREIFNRNFSMQCQPVIELVDMDRDNVLPATADGKCVFLNNLLNCNIYNDRPGICRKFGDESHINMTCAYQTKEGNKRSSKDKKKISEAQTKAMNNFLNR